MRERVSPRTIFREVRKHWPDALLALRELPKVVQSAIREAGEERPQPVNMPALRAQMQRSQSARDFSVAAAVLWLSGLIWLALSNRLLWLGWAQMLGAILIFVRLRMRRSE
jgi:hypothetical protein